MTTLLGKSLQGGKYTLDEELGQGGFGITFKALHHFLDEPCVVKTLNPEFFHDPQFQKMAEKFRAEAKCLKACEHPNIVRMRDFFVEDGIPYLVMDYIPGQSLEKIVFPDKPLPEAVAVHYIRQIGEALEVVHQNGLLHRDLKPENIILKQGTDQVILIDFGIAREFTPGKTAVHTSLVTVGYAPVEQYMQQARRSPATDVYGLAATLYALVTARVPIASIMRDRQMMPEPRTLNPYLSPAINQAILRGMAIDAEQRPATVAQWLTLLPNIAPPNQAASNPATSRGHSPSTAATMAISPPAPNPYTPNPYTPNPYTPNSYTPTPQASTPNAPPPPISPTPNGAPSPRPAARKPASSTVATVAISPHHSAPPPTAATVSPPPVQPNPAPQRSAGKIFAFLGLVTLASIAIAAVVAVLQYNEQFEAERDETTVEEVAPEVSEGPGEFVEPEIIPPVVEEPEASPEPEEPDEPEATIPPGASEDAENDNEPNGNNQPPPQVAPPAPQRPPGVAVPVRGFPPGTSEGEIAGVLGAPTQDRNDGNARVVVYTVPEQVDLVYIYEPGGDRIQQTEALFSPYVDFNVMRTALNGMLDYRSNEAIEQGLRDVRDGRIPAFPIDNGRFQGRIEQSGDRIHIWVR